MKSLKFITAMILVSIMAMTVTGCASTYTQEGAGEYVDDSVITTKIKAAILNEPTLQSMEISVETFKGIVQLSGFVSSVADINRAVQLAQGVAGVKSVNNSMHVK